MATNSFKEVAKTKNQIYIKHEKNEVVSQIRQLLGYGGFIHNFKNYTIRKIEKYATDAQNQYVQLLAAIDNYKAIKGVTAQEMKQLKVLEDTFAIYMQKLPKITKSFQDGLAVSALDKIVKVNDTFAIEALDKLTGNMHGSQSDWFKHSTQKINSLKEVEDQIAYDLKVLINSNNNDLSRELIIQAVILIIILIIILLSYIMLRELIESKKVLNRAQENTSSGSYEYYIEDNVILWSDEHYKLLQVDKEKFKPTMDTFMIFIHPDDVEIVNNGFELAKTSKEMVFFEYRLFLFDNTKMYVRSSAEVIKYNKKGDPLIIVGTITDITQSKKLEREIVDTQKDVILTMGTISETRSMETGNHVKRVAEYSKLLHLLNGAKEDEAELLKMASPMHDIGKVGIPDHILNKPGKLTPGEWAIMQTHSEMGYDMFKNSEREILKLAATISLTHHEKYDGSGYPKGLVAGEIPLVGRITALADVFDALGSDRCYKLAWELEDILELIKIERGKHFDPVLVDLFLKHINMFIHIRDNYKEIDN
ncbi:MAG: HD domain-containing protein [Sulfurimonas sp.]|nr:HD domain-containing protein [Sulfurimonas sp.]